MISDRQLIHGFSSLWQGQAPRLGDITQFLNINVKSFGVHVPSNLSPDRRSFVGELGFRVFCEAVAAMVDPTLVPINNTQLDACEKYVENLIPTNRRSNFRLTADYRAELVDARHEAANLWSYFEPLDLTKIVTRPPFRGCGIIDACEGDLLHGQCLYEIKSRQRRFEQVDLRQIITYAVLSYVQDPSRILQLSLINPHRGRVVTIEWARLAQSVSGNSVGEFVGSFVEILTQSEQA